MVSSAARPITSNSVIASIDTTSLATTPGDVGPVGEHHFDGCVEPSQRMSFAVPAAPPPDMDTLNDVSVQHSKS